MEIFILSCIIIIIITIENWLVQKRENEWTRNWFGRRKIFATKLRTSLVCLAIIEWEAGAEARKEPPWFDQWMDCNRNGSIGCWISQRTVMVWLNWTENFQLTILYFVFIYLFSFIFKSFHSFGNITCWAVQLWPVHFLFFDLIFQFFFLNITWCKQVWERKKNEHKIVNNNNNNNLLAGKHPKNDVSNIGW